MQLSMKIGTLLSAIQKYKNIKLNYDEEVNVEKLNVKIRTPTRQYETIQYVIKKQAKGVKLFFDNAELTCANKHILYNKEYLPVHADTLCVGDYIRTLTGMLKIENIEYVDTQDFYDVTIPSPHIYVDSNEIVHHNSLLSAVLSKKVEKYGRSIVIVPNKDLITQTEKYYVDLGLDVGVYYGDRKEFFKTHTIATWQSLTKLIESPIDIGLDEPVTFSRFVQGVVAVIIDEAHGLRANFLKDMLTGPLAKVPIRWAVTGTIPKEEFEMVNLTISVGAVMHQLETSELQEKGILSNCDVNVLQLQDIREFTSYSAEYDFLVTNESRLEFVCEIIKQAAESGNVLVLVGRKETGKAMEKMIPDSIFLSGDTKTKTRKAHYDEVAVSNSKVIIATSGIAAVGLDIPRINHLVMFESGKSFVRTIQSIGRALRTSFDKNHATIWDICSTCRFSKRHLTNRKKFYTEQQFPYKITKVDWQQ